jgi:iron complex transport system ATP-binding protein
MKPILEIENLSCGYNKEQIINNLSFSIEKGSFSGIIGPNGAGKTTLFKAITGILPPKQGKILYENQNINQMPPKKFAQKVSVIPQITEVPFAFSVEEFVSMGRFPHVGRFEFLKKTDYLIIEEALTLTDLTALRKRSISELSGGERQRAIIAQSFAQQPNLLLLDEPTSHLDITHQIQILDLIKNLNKTKNLTVIIILHDLNLASIYCDKIILIDKGKIFKKGTPQDVLTYQNIEEVYKTIVVVEKNPLNSKPYVFLVSKEERKKIKVEG